MREVDLRLARALEPADADVSYHAHHRAIRSSEPEAAADGILPRPVTLGQGFADDGHEGSLAGVGVAEVAAGP